MLRTYIFLQSLLADLRQREAGQTMAEYAIVLAVIAVVLVVALTYLSGGIKGTLSKVTSDL
ncbi:MAG TPA: Flp family type IVb pilin [Gaiellales bacterium]|jgi:Flp pilus assembly pilin Flp